jgi:hypothetical protein
VAVEQGSASTFNELQHKSVLCRLWSIWLSQVVVVVQTMVVVVLEVSALIRLP